MSAQRFICSADRETLSAFFAERGAPAFRTDQALDWIYRKAARSPKELTNFPLAERNALAEAFRWDVAATVSRQEAPDGTVKFASRLFDGEIIETVLIPFENGRRSVCVSSQVGCPVRCAFCASGQRGWTRDLDAAEIVAQFLAAFRELGTYPDNLVLMGIGEPLLNFDAVVQALTILNDPERVGFAARRITLSTSGVPDKIRELADMEKQWNLAVSLHAPDDRTRAKIIPERHRHPLANILDACAYYRKKTSRMVTFEYALLKDVNDSAEQAKQLAALAKKWRSKVNLIPCNSAPNSGFAPPTPERSRQFEKILLDAGVRVTVRREKGAAIAAACGQLRARLADADTRTPPATVT